MPSGIRLSATLTIPISTYISQRYPVLLQYKPYRKDDNSFYNDRSITRYLARRGFIVAQVDIRGTGSSEGALPEREYSVEELDDCIHVIEQLAKHRYSNGKVGMFGISWSAFNTLMMGSIRRPSALSAIFAVHGSEDLYRNDVHYPDGILHFDDYRIFIDHTNGLPASSSNYRLDARWFRDRFTRHPWIDYQLSHQLDDTFWKQHSVKYAYENFSLPIYLIGGLYDPYTDFAMRIYEGAYQKSPKIKVAIGPFVHAFPEAANAHPGPGFDGKAEIVRWFNHWLKEDAKDDTMMDEPNLVFYIRTGITSGYYRYESEWPIRRQTTKRMYMSQNHQLIEKDISDSMHDIDILEYRPWIGFEGYTWLQQLTGDQKMFDKDCLIYDSDPVAENFEIIGFVNVSLQVSSTAPLAHWIVRLEDVTADGQVLPITEGALNGAQREMPPTYLEPNNLYTISFTLRFTTWTVFTGHRVRVAISNAMFPEYWPSPYPMNTSIIFNSRLSYIDLPILPYQSPIPPPPPFTQQQVPSDDIIPGMFSGSKPRRFHKEETSLSTTITFERASYQLLPTNYFMSTAVTWNFTCSHLDPADVKWSGRAQQIFVFDVHGYASIADVPLLDNQQEISPNMDLSTRRHFKLVTESVVYSNQEYFFVDFRRQLFSNNATNGHFPMKFEFRKKYPRQYQ